MRSLSIPLLKLSSMQIVADLQLHSKYSRAVSPKMDLEEIARWSAKKGIQLVATGDWTHPMWIREIKAKLKETSPGIYSLNQDKTDLPSSDNVKFLLSTEISSIYTQDGKGRRVHNLIFSPSIETCEKIIKEFQRRGANLMSDGRPIVGISSKDLLEMVLTIDKTISKRSLEEMPTMGLPSDMRFAPRRWNSLMIFSQVSIEGEKIRL